MELYSFQICTKVINQFQIGSDNDTDTQRMLIKKIRLMYFS
jgi:hypothetical protein